MRHRSKMKCDACDEHPAWHRTVDGNGNSTLKCGLCGHFQQPRITAAKQARVAAKVARLNAIAKWLDRTSEKDGPISFAAKPD